MGLHETIQTSGTGPSVEDVAVLAKRLLGSIVGVQTDRTKSIVSALSMTSARIDRLNDELNRSNADRLRLATELNDANTRCASAEAAHRDLLFKYAELARKVVESDDSAVGVNERIQAAIFTSEIALHAGESVDLTPSHTRNFIHLPATQPS
jgi:septal ring factor EnvC (AmiA/AmiB activator)